VLSYFRGFVIKNFSASYLQQGGEYEREISFSDLLWGFDDCVAGGSEFRYGSGQ
jgi:hypothetical protein